MLFPLPVSLPYVAKESSYNEIEEWICLLAVNNIAVLLKVKEHCLLGYFHYGIN
jgi:hypothetical protein